MVSSELQDTSCPAHRLHEMGKGNTQDVKEEQYPTFSGLRILFYGFHKNTTAHSLPDGRLVRFGALTNNLVVDCSSSVHGFTTLHYTFGLRNRAFVAIEEQPTHILAISVPSCTNHANVSFSDY